MRTVGRRWSREGPARDVRPCPVRRQGRRCQPRALGLPRRSLDRLDRREVRRSRCMAARPGHARLRTHAAAGNARPRRRDLRPAQPGRGQCRAARTARARRRRVHPVRSAGEGARRVGAFAVRRDPGGPDVSEREALREVAREFTRREVTPYLQDWEDAGEVPRDLHRAAAKQGLLGVAFPTDAGGEGGDLLGSIAVMEGMFEAGASSGLMAALFTSGIALPHLAASGNQDLVDRFVRPTLAGELIGSLAVTEPGGGSDVASIRTTARHDGDAYVVNGTKTFITSGVRADFVTTAVRTGGPGHAGISLLVVERGTPGFTVDRSLAKTGWHCSDTAELGYADVRVPVGNLVGAENAGFAQIA